ncbi:MAG TPA: hypothetical protein VE693_04615 [Gaiellaceae bacterium]|nr:hypothetical protein [Gaiellaceae bacterium]
MRRRPGLIALGIVLVSLGAGIVYAVVTGRNSSGIEENRRALAAAGAYPGAERVGSGSTAAFPENGLPVPRGVVTTAAYRPPVGAKQIDVVDFYVTRLRGRWTPNVERSLAGPSGERAFRVTFSRDERCLALLTAGMLVSQEDERVYTLSAYGANDHSC